MHKKLVFKKAFKNKGLLYLVDNHPNDTQYIGDNVRCKVDLEKKTRIIFQKTLAIFKHIETIELQLMSDFLRHIFITGTLLILCELVQYKNK